MKFSIMNTGWENALEVLKMLFAKKSKPPNVTIMAYVFWGCHHLGSRKTSHTILMRFSPDQASSKMVSPKNRILGASHNEYPVHPFAATFHSLGTSVPIQSGYNLVR